MCIWGEERAETAFPGGWNSMSTVLREEVSQSTLKKVGVAGMEWGKG